MAGSSDRRRELARAITNIYFSLKDYIQRLPTLREIVLNFLIPGVLAILLLQFAWKLLGRCKRWLFPPSVSALHREALLTLNQGHERDAEILLWQAVQRDATFVPALLSLVALYTYSDPPQCSKAWKLLESDFCKANNEFKVIWQDCQAIQSGQAVMVQTLLRRDQFLSLSSLSKAS